MAEYLGGSEENFVNMMNEKAKVLGMNDTCFKNCHGIDEDGHVMSAPISKGQELGKVSYTLNGEVISEGTLISDSDIPKINIFTMNEKVIGKWYNMLRD